MKLRRQSHAVYRCEYHIVWIPRFRYKVLVEGVAQYLEIKLNEVRKLYPEIEFIEMSIQPDHVHLLVSFPPKFSISKVVQLLKQNTSAALKTKFPFLKQRYWGREGIWSVGYFASTVGIDEAVILKYVQQQGEEDSGQATLEIG